MDRKPGARFHNRLAGNVSWPNAWNRARLHNRLDRIGSWRGEVDAGRFFDRQGCWEVR